MTTSPNPKPATFFARFPCSNLPSSAFVTCTRRLGLLTRFIRLRTGCPLRCLCASHIRFAGGDSVAKSAGDGCVGVPRVIEEMKPCRKRSEVIARDELEYGSDV